MKKCFQYYIENTGQYHGYKGQDINMSLYLNQKRDEVLKNITILVNDKSLFYKHFAFNNKINLQLSNSFPNNENLKIQNNLINDKHGTAITSIIVGNELDSFCFTGLIKSNVSIIFNSLIHDELKVNEVIQAFSANLDNYQIACNSWSFESCIHKNSNFLIQNEDLENDENNYCPTFYKENQFITDLFNLLCNKGKIIIYSAGNDGFLYGDTNSLPFINHRNIFIVSSSTNRGEHCYFSNRGTSIFLNTPSILTRDKETELILTNYYRKQKNHSIKRNNKNSSNLFNKFDENKDKPVFILPSIESEYSFTNEIGGTSVSSPQLAGIIGIMLQINPNLTIRDIKYILLSTLTINDCEHYTWIENSAGIYYSTLYGFGRLNGGKAIDLAKKWNIKLPKENKISITKTFLIHSNDQETENKNFYINNKNCLNNNSYNKPKNETIEIIKTDNHSNITLSIENDETIFIETVEILLIFNNLNSDFLFSFLKIFVESPKHTITNPKIISHSKEDVDIIKTKEQKQLKFLIHSFFGEDAKGNWNIYLQLNQYFPIKNANISLSLTINGIKEKVNLKSFNNFEYTTKLRFNYQNNKNNEEINQINNYSKLNSSLFYNNLNYSASKSLKNYSMNSDFVKTSKHEVSQNEINQNSRFMFNLPEYVITGTFLNVPITYKSKNSRIFQFFIEDEEFSNQILLRCFEISKSQKYIKLFIPTLFKNSKVVYIVAESFIDDFIWKCKTKIIHETNSFNKIIPKSKFSNKYSLIYHEFHEKMDFSSHCSVTIIKHDKQTKLQEIISKNVFKNTGKVDLKLPYFHSYDIYLTAFEDINISNNYFHHFYIQQHTLSYYFFIIFLSFLLFLIFISIFVSLNHFNRSLFKKRISKMYKKLGEEEPFL